MVIEKWIQYRKNNSKNRFVKYPEVWDLEILFSIPYKQKIDISLTWRNKHNLNDHIHVESFPRQINVA